MSHMQPQRETMTNSLADIIQVIYLGNRNGTLTVERGKGKTLEEGSIVFFGGRAIEANAGRLRGVAAFNYLNTWHECRFSFVDGVTTPPQLSQSPSDERLGMTSSAPIADSVEHIITAPLNQKSVMSNYAGSGIPSAFPVLSQLGEATLQHPESMQLSRVHRRLLLLINGQRSIRELARLNVLSYKEVRSLLNDLEYAGFIKQ
jgi:hypothetical protein